MSTELHPTVGAAAPLLVEIGCEEIPAGVVPVAAAALLDGILKVLDEAGIAHAEACWLGTPRRLVAHVHGVALQQPDRHETLTGPPLRAAQDASGQWTKAAEGFARGLGLTTDALAVLETPKGAYVAVERTLQGRTTATVLGEALPDVLRNLPFPKKMRWGREREAFIRPVHWLVSLLGETVVPFTFAGVASGRLSWGHRFYRNEALAVPADLDAYKAALAQAFVQVDPEVRRADIRKQVIALSQSAGGTWVQDEETLEVVTYLVEWPAPLLGKFAPEFLEIPAPVIRTTLRENQKLFTIQGPDGKLLDRFVAVANTLSEQSRETIAQGNARVVSARLSDARFFVREDTKAPLETKLASLDDRIWLAGLGSIGDKARRIGKMSAALAARLCPAETVRVARTAQLCKADLATRMVFEFPELQGVIGADYALVGGEDPIVARAIAQHYQPRFAGDAIPQDAAGALVSLADKIDAIVGCFALGLIPSGTQDPYALRRQALGILRIITEGGYAIALSELVTLAIEGIAPAREGLDAVALRDDVLRFFRGRLASLYQADYPVDLVEAVLEAGHDRPGTIAPRLQALNKLRSGEGFAPLAAAFKRVGNLVRKAGDDPQAGREVDPKLFQEPAESALHAAVAGVAEAVSGAVSRGDYDAALGHLVVIKPAVDGFFDGVMVMTDDEALRRNRLALLRTCAGLFAQVADFARLQA